MGCITRCMNGAFLQPLLLRFSAPQSRSAMGTQMSKLNWRSSDAYYDRAQRAEMTGLAWECLRRNPSFRRDQRIVSAASPTATAETRQRWGLVFRG